MQMRFAFRENADMTSLRSGFVRSLGVSLHGYRARRDCPFSACQRKDLVVLARIGGQFTLSPGGYGRSRIAGEF